MAAVKLAQTVELWGVPANWSEIAGFYLEAVEDLPPDVLDATLREARLTLKWLPKPAELRALAREEMGLRLEALDTARTKAKNWRDSLPPEIDIAERKRVGAKFGELLASLPKPQRVPAHTDDMKPKL